MCGRYTLRVTGEEIADRFDATPRADFEPTYNAAPGQELPVVRSGGSEEGTDDTDSIERLRWGLVPSWADEGGDGHINARAETVAEKPSFADAYERRRCLVPADGFYEWTDDDEGPWYVEFDGVVGLAGVWERWVPEKRQTGLDSFGDSKEVGREVVESFAVLTTEPNEEVSRLHHRMAAVLAPEEENGWLDGSMEADDLGPRELDVDMDIRRVSERVNSPKNDDASLVEAA